jgi:uncharacterized protein YndB with AHSA1/START domain
MKQIIHVVDMKAERDQVYTALTTHRGLTGWWTTDVTADTTVGGRIDFRFGTVFNAQMRIAALEPVRRVEWKGVGGEQAWLDNRFIFDLGERTGMTLLTFTQDYARELDDEAYGRFNFNWGYYLQSLRELCETGTGFPFGTK